MNEKYDLQCPHCSHWVFKVRSGVRVWCMCGELIQESGKNPTAPRRRVVNRDPIPVCPTCLKPAHGYFCHLCGDIRDPRPMPGSELYALVPKSARKHGDCACNNHAAEMNANGVEWCEENKDMLLDRMVGASPYKVPSMFQRWALSRLFDKAMKNARKASM